MCFVWLPFLAAFIRWWYPHSFPPFLLVDQGLTEGRLLSLTKAGVETRGGGGGGSKGVLLPRLRCLLRAERIAATGVVAELLGQSVAFLVVDAVPVVERLDYLDSKAGEYGVASLYVA